MSTAREADEVRHRCGCPIVSSAIDARTGRISNPSFKGTGFPAINASKKKRNIPYWVETDVFVASGG